MSFHGLPKCVWKHLDYIFIDGSDADFPPRDISTSELGWRESRNEYVKRI